MKKKKNTGVSDASTAYDGHMQQPPDFVRGPATFTDGRDGSLHLPVFGRFAVRSLQSQSGGGGGLSRCCVRAESEN